MKRLITICMVLGMLLIASADVNAVIDTRLLLHLNGEDGATTTVDSSAQNHAPISFFGNAQLDTAYKYDGSASLLLDGTGDYLTTPDSADWDICGSSTDNWTIDFRVKMTDHSGSEYFIAQGENSTNRWGLLHTHGSGIRFLMMSNGTLAINAPAQHVGEIKDTDWHWIALSKVGSLYGVYLDGKQVAYTNDTSTDIFAAPLDIGQDGYSSNYLASHMDDLRIAHSNIFDASPNATLTNTITYVACVPEPATIVLLGLGALSLLHRKRSR
ncbi:MAG: LamG-like jellyroll fold domain-containing protein [Sedimentisphaerales bacterium]